MYTKYEDIPAPVKKSRRRSSFFAEARRRSLGNSLRDSCNPQSPTSAEKEAYIKYLEEEAKEWKDTFESRRADYKRKYNEFCQERPVMTEEEGWALLDEDQKQYLSNLPDFSHIESKFNYNKELVTLLQDINVKNEITMNRIIGIAEEKMEDCKAKIHRYAKSD